MPLTVNMPQLGESVTEGTIARWLKQPGEQVARYESIAEVITDKVNAEIPAPADGTMAEIIAPEGAVVAVGQPICSIETEATAGAAQLETSAPAQQSQQETSAPASPQSMPPTQTSPAAPTPPAQTSPSAQPPVAQPTEAPQEQPVAQTPAAQAPSAQPETSAPAQRSQQETSAPASPQSMPPTQTSPAAPPPAQTSPSAQPPVAQPTEAPQEQPVAQTPAAQAPSAQPETSAPASPQSMPPTQTSPSALGSPSAEQSASRGGNGAALYHMTPAVRMLVREHDVDIEQVRGSGIGGRVTKKDVLEYVQRRDAGAPAAPTPEPTAAPEQAGTPATASPQSRPPSQASPPAPTQPSAPGFAAGEGDTVVPLTSVRRAIAEHMVRSRHTSPHAYCMVEVDMSAVARIRERERKQFEQRYGVKLTYLPFVARAVCEALHRHPTLNSSWSDEGIVLKRDIHLGIAVALEDNLVVPVVRNADRLSISGLATTMADLGERARANRLKLDEIQGGTFTLNNTGALGAVMTQAIINQPQAAIMTMDLVVKRPVIVANDAIAIRPIMNLGMSFDHRIVDGLQATRFVRTVKDLLEGFDERAPL